MCHATVTILCIAETFWFFLSQSYTISSPQIISGPLQHVAFPVEATPSK